MSEESPNIVALQLLASKSGNYCVAYDLKDGKEWKGFNLPTSIEKEDNWKEIYMKLSKKCPPNIVKSFLLNVFDVIPGNEFCIWYRGFKKLGNEFGYSNFNYVTDLAFVSIDELLLAKKKGKKYEIGDCVIVGRYFELPLLNSEIHILKKQEIGWDFVAGKVGESFFTHSEHLNELLEKHGITMDKLKDVFLKLRNGYNVKKFQDMLKMIYPPKKLTFGVLLTERTQLLERVGEYLSKVYAGEEYFNDYDCFVGRISEPKFELKCGNILVELPIQYKRLPCTIKRKFKFNNCDKIELLISIDHLANQEKKGRRVIHTANVKMNGEICVVTLIMDQNKTFYYKIEKDDEQKTLISSFSKNFEYVCPRFVFGKDYCSVKYYEEGLLWELKDINGNVKIPFKISFGDEIHVGQAALEHPDFLMPEIDLEMLLNDAVHHELSKNSDNIIQADDKEFKILLKTVKGIQKTTPKNIFAIFLKSIVTLLESKLGETVERIYYVCDFENNSAQIDAMISKSFNSLKIIAEQKVENESF